MSRRLENPFNRPDSDGSSHYLGVVLQLLESLNDKDEQVRKVSEVSLIKIADKKPDEVILHLCEYKKKNVKIADSISAVILR